jgi:hypothetical protein
MRRMRAIVSGLCLLMLAETPGTAENIVITVAAYRAAMASNNTQLIANTKLFIYGLGEGMGWANNSAREAKLSLFCPPNNLTMSENLYLDIVDRAIQTRAVIPKEKLDEMPVGVLLFKGLQETFPCVGKLK